MKITLTPETPEEKRMLNVADLEHEGVGTVMIFGTETDADGKEREFHFWHGSHRYLYSNLVWFTEIINEERKVRDEQLRQAESIGLPKMFKYGDQRSAPAQAQAVQEAPKLEVVNANQAAEIVETAEEATENTDVEEAADSVEEEK